MTTETPDKILIFEPQFKSVIWGGERIAALKGIECSKSDIGESWEISALEGHESINAGGIDKGLTISQLTERYGELLLGSETVRRYGKKFPLLIKLLDAHDILSVQVHPDDKTAEQFHCSRGKSEMWYVIDAKKDARIYCGFSEQISPESFDRHISSKSIMDVIASYPSHSGQFYFIPAGTIHTLGPGNLIAEIQESSDVTYRVFDHDRRDSSGQQRELHLDEARAALDYTFPSKVTPTATAYESTRTDAVSCEHFKVDFYKIDDNSTTITQNHESFRVILVTEGSVDIEADGEKLTISKGHTALIPAFVDRITLSGNGIAIVARI